jgi:hypothetical protein
VSAPDPTVPDQERGDELGVGVEDHPCPDVARLSLHAERRVPGLAVDEAPDLVDLESLAGQVHHDLVQIGARGLPEVHQELGHGVLGSAGHPHGGPDRVALDQGSDDLGSALGG